MLADDRASGRSVCGTLASDLVRRRTTRCTSRSLKPRSIPAARTTCWRRGMNGSPSCPLASIRIFPAARGEDLDVADRHGVGVARGLDGDEGFRRASRSAGDVRAGRRGTHPVAGRRGAREPAFILNGCQRLGARSMLLRCRRKEKGPMSVLVQMRVTPPDVEKFKAAYAAWGPRIADFGGRSLGVYQAEGSGEVTLLEEWESHDSMHEASEKTGTSSTLRQVPRASTGETRIGTSSRRGELPGSPGAHRAAERRGRASPLLGHRGGLRCAA